MAVKRFLGISDGIGCVATLGLPIFLTHGRGVAEACMDILAVLLLLRSVVAGEWSWAKVLWFRVGIVWWGWQVFCSLPVAPFGIGGTPAFLQSLMAIRFLLLAAALQSWTLQDATLRRVTVALICLAGLYITAQIVLQATVGVNTFGYRRFPDGTLTGPYSEPRAAAPLSRLLLPMLMLACVAVQARVSSAWARFGSLAFLAVASLSVMVLAGQRMPFLLFSFGLVILAWFYRPVRPAVIIAAMAAPLILLIVRFASPGSFQHLILLAERQLTHFGHSPYGAVFTRGIVMGESAPLTGLGYDAFRHGCRLPAYFHGLPWLDDSVNGGGAAICVQHAHNHYLQAITNAGIPGLILFTALILAWLMALWPRERAGQSPYAHAWRIGIFAAVFIQEWPIASTSDFLNLPLGGWAFLLLGTGLAMASAPVMTISGRLYQRRNAPLRI